jgi:carbon monoxide dehydrogenase subunit G
MQIEDQFRVPVPVDDAWRLLLDIERIAPCLPGAQLQEVEGDEYRGVVKVKVGPITAQYKGTAHLEQVDDAAHTAVLRAIGRDTRGQGNASAAIKLAMRADGDATVVSIDADLAVTGKVAQFGRGVLADVSAKLLTQFVDNLERDVLAGDAPRDDAPRDDAPREDAPREDETTAYEATAPVMTDAPLSGNGAAVGAVRRIESADAEPVDLFHTAGLPVARRLLPVLGAALLLWLLFRRRRKRRAR